MHYLSYNVCSYFSDRGHGLTMLGHSVELSFVLSFPGMQNGIKAAVVYSADAASYRTMGGVMLCV